MCVTVRKKRIRLNEDEHEKLIEYKESNYHDRVPLGEVIGDLVDEAI